MKIEKWASGLSGEMDLLPLAEAESDTIPFAPGFDLEMLKEVDDDPMFATVRIKSGPGQRGDGPEYGNDILQSLEAQINEKRPPGYKGHQDPDRIAWEYREPVTAWVGAKYDDGVLIVKGYIPPTAQDLRTQLRLAKSGADVVNSVSIFGVRGVEDDKVRSFDLWSLDWTPKGRAGMQTELVAVSGEQAKEDDVTREEVIASLKPEEVPEHLVQGFKDEALAGVSGEAALAGEIRVTLDLGDADPTAIVDAVRGLVSTSQAAELDERVEEAMEDKVSGEMARAAVKDAVLPAISVKTTDEELAGEITKALEKPYIVALVKGDAFPVISGGAGKQEEEARTGTSWE